MEFSNYFNIIAVGFCVWLLIAPQAGNPGFREQLTAYMTALLLSLIGTSEIMLVKPVAFFFSVGGVLAFCYVIARSVTRVSIKNK